MQEDPNEPSDEPAHAKAPALQNREILADDRHVALVGVAKLAFWLQSLEPLRNETPEIAPLLDRRLRDAGHWPAIAYDRCNVANDEHADNALNIHEWAEDRKSV